jgi:hypothetical protein
MPNPGSGSFNVTFCVFIVLPQACAASPALENSPKRRVTSAFADAA